MALSFIQIVDLYSVPFRFCGFLNEKYQMCELPSIARFPKSGHTATDMDMYKILFSILENKVSYILN